MAIQFDPTDDFASVIDNMEAATVQRPGSSQTSSTNGALRRAVTTREAQTSQGEYTLSDVVWHLPADDIVEPPRPADIIVDGDGTRWTVLDVSRTTADSRWRCVCRNLVVAHGLDQFVDIERAVYTKDIRGARQASWHLSWTGLAAKIQPVAAQNTDGNQQDVTLGEYRVFLAESIELDHTHRIKGPDGRRYVVKGYNKPDRIDALLEIDAQRVT